MWVWFRRCRGAEDCLLLLRLLLYQSILYLSEIITAYNITRRPVPFEVGFLRLYNKD